MAEYTVFVGNVRRRSMAHAQPRRAHSLPCHGAQIPYDVTEEQLAGAFVRSAQQSSHQLQERFRAAGDVIRFRLQMDGSTGKTKGFGFCDYATAEGAQTALRTLNGIEVNGRMLRVDSAERDQPKMKQARDIEAALAQMTVGEVYDILVEFKAWLKRDAEAARVLLVQRPVLAQALLKMQTCMGNMTGAPPADALFAPYLNQPAAPAGSSAASAAAAAPVQPDAETYALLNQALAMTEEQISAYPPQQQELFRQIRYSAMQRR